MNSWPLVVIGIIVFTLVFSSVLLISQWLRQNQLKQRLKNILDAPLPKDITESTSSGFIEYFIKKTSPLVQLTVPDQSWEESPIRAKFMFAGWRSVNAPKVFFGIKAILALLLPIIWLLVLVAFGKTHHLIITSGMVASGIAGLYFPDLVLNRRIKIRQQELFENFPDCLDLITICIEAGLSLEAALTRVAEEISSSSKLLANELELVVLEMRAGRGRDTALRNLAKRNGLEELESLVSTLVQAEQFGISIGDSLRTHSDLLRNKRQQKAEEIAATVGTRLTFPLLVCIMPILMIVVVGPAVIRLLSSLGKV